MVELSHVSGVWRRMLYCRSYVHVSRLHARLLTIGTEAICGWIADRTSNRSGPYYFGLLLLFGSTLVCGIAPAAWALVMARACQGVSSAIVYTVGLAVLVDTVGREDIGQWMGAALSSASLGLILSPLLGGIIYARAGYVAVFAMSMALIAIDFVMRLIMIEKKTEAKYMADRRLAIGGQERYGTFVNETPHGVNGNGRTHGSPDRHEPELPNELISESQQNLHESIDDAIVLLHKVLANGHAESGHRRQSQVPTIIRLLSMPRILAAIYGVFVNIATLAAFDGVLPLFVDSMFGWKSLESGFIFLCLAVPAMSAPLVGRLCDKFGPRWITVAGCVLTAPFVILLRLVDHDSMEQKILLFALLTMCGMLILQGDPSLRTLTIR